MVAAFRPKYKLIIIATAEYQERSMLNAQCDNIPKKQSRTFPKV